MTATSFDYASGSNGSPAPSSLSRGGSLGHGHATTNGTTGRGYHPYARSQSARSSPTGYTIPLDAQHDQQQQQQQEFHAASMGMMGLGEYGGATNAAGAGSASGLYVTADSPGEYGSQGGSGSTGGASNAPSPFTAFQQQQQGQGEEVFAYGGGQQDAAGSYYAMTSAS